MAEPRGRRQATLVPDGTEHRFRAGGLPSLLDQRTDLLRVRVVLPHLRPVLLTTGLPGGPTRITLWPDGGVDDEYPDDADDPDAAEGLGDAVT